MAGDAGAHRYFHVDWIPPALREVASTRPVRRLVDLGAGDGSTLYALDRAGLLPPEVVAVDLSAERVALCETIAPQVRGVVGDATATGLPDGSADAVVASQLIEHVPDEAALMREVARLLAPDGWFYVSSVVRGRHAFWIYRAGGRWAVDPTHVREYASEDAFAAALAAPGLELTRVSSEPLRFPALDLALRAAALARVVRFSALPRAYERLPGVARTARALRVPVPGYRWVEAVGRRA